MNITIRLTIDNDLKKIIHIHKVAFKEEESVAELTAELLKDKTAEPRVSLIALNNDKPIGHILFTNCTIEGIAICPLMHILAPLGIIPEYQNKGVGGKLIKEGIKLLKEINSKMVFALGHIEYYPKYGFIKDAEKLGYIAPYPIPAKVADAWMVQSLTDDNELDFKGTIICANAMDEAEYWIE